MTDFDNEQASVDASLFTERYCLPKPVHLPKEWDMHQAYMGETASMVGFKAAKTSIDDINDEWH